jgi:hypothetical protein
MEAACTDHQTLTRQQVSALGEQIAEHAAHLDAATHSLLADLRSFDAAGGWYHQGARNCAEWLSWRVGWSGNTAREHVRVANRLGELPLIDDALRRGELSYCKVRAMTRVATRENEALLLEDARLSTGSQLEQICSKYSAVRRREGATANSDTRRRQITKRELDDGMVALNAVLLPDEAMLVWECLTRIARDRAVALANEERFAHDQTPVRTPTIEHAKPERFSRVDALVQLSTAALRGDRPERSPVEVVVTVSAETLDGCMAEGVGTTSDGTCLSAQLTRRLACDAGVVMMVEDAVGNPLLVGRKTRSIPASTKRALLKRDRTCRFPGCCNRVFLDGHHAKHWAEGGETTLANLVSLCGFHHRFVHEYGYRVKIDSLQQPHFYDPHGRLVPPVPAPCATAWQGIDAIRDDNAALGISSGTNAPRWDGSCCDYGLVIDELCRADQPGGRFRGNASREQQQT